MLYSRLVEAYEQIGGTTRRREITDTLVALLKETPPDLVGRLVYLTQGKLHPDFAGVEMGLAERLALRAVAEAAGVEEAEVARALAARGDLGAAAESLLRAKDRQVAPTLSVDEVYDHLDGLARTSGKGAIGTKLTLLVDLLTRATPTEAKYILRSVTGKLRLGLADMTMLDGLAAAYAGDIRARKVLERAYNLSSDLGAIATAVARGGLEAARSFHLQPGRPVRPMLAQRSRSPGEILRATGGRCQAEYKYDGERLQIHKAGDRVLLFSRQLEDATAQYPDVVELVRSGVAANEAVLEVEVMAMSPEAGELLPFQELMHRRRKHEVEAMMAQYPAAIFAFDLLFLDGRDLTGLPFPERREALEMVVKPSGFLRLMPARIVDRVEDLEVFFQEAVAEGCEGLVCKSLGPNSTYEAGARGWNWIKWKREYVSAMTDTVDLVVVGALHGRGRRGGVYGALLLSAYDPETDSFPTVTKCGVGFTDKDLAELPARLESHRLDHRHPRVNAKMQPDVWFEPSLVIEVLGAETTLSPIHTVGWGVFRQDAGLAIRFPRFTGRYRDDKAPEDATSVAEIAQMYRSRLKKVAA